MYSHKKWIVNLSKKEQLNNKIILNIAESLNVSLSTASLLMQRGCLTPDSARSFLSKSDDHFYDPFLMKDVRKAAKRILDAIKSGEKIYVYGDYDVDGVTSVSILVLYLRSLGAEVDYFIPSRQGEGYGVSKNALESIAENSCQLLITVDTGITAINEMNYAKFLGMDVIITDHHECLSQVPDALAVINPKQVDCSYPFKELAGVGVVFKLICAIQILAHPNQTELDNVREVCNQYIDLVAIGTIADVMPLVDENRLIVSYGLSMIQNTQRVALQELLNVCSGDSLKNRRRRITSSFISYSVAPRINAVGRMKNASIAVELFLTIDHEKAYKIATELSETNTERQNEENEIVASIRESYDQRPILNENVIVLSDNHWHHGIIGIVASKITEKYSKPSIMISFEPSGGMPDYDADFEISDEDIGKGSCRTVPGINLIDALRSCSDLLEKFGGHEMAAGLSIKRKNVDEFRKRINEYVDSIASHNGDERLITADLELDFSDLTIKQAKELLLLEPYGVSNELPLFYLSKAHVLNVSDVGQGKHVKLIIGSENNRETIQAMLFRTSKPELEFCRGDVVDLLFNLDINSYQGVETPQLIVNAVRFPQEADEFRVESGKRFFQWLNSDTKNNYADEKDIPTRDEFAYIYKALLSLATDNHFDAGIFAFEANLLDQGCQISRFKLFLILHVLNEMKIIDFTLDEKDHMHVVIFKTKMKVDLFQSELMKCLQEKDYD